MGDEQRLPADELLVAAREAFDAGTDFTIAVEEEFALLDPATLDLVEPVRGGAGRLAGTPRSSRTSSAS